MTLYLSQLIAIDSAVKMERQEIGTNDHWSISNGEVVNNDLMTYNSNNNHHHHQQQQFFHHHQEQHNFHQGQNFQNLKFNQVFVTDRKSFCNENLHGLDGKF